MFGSLCPSHLYIGWGVRLGARGRSPVFGRLWQVLRHKPGEAWPPFEVHNAVLAVLFREALGCDLARQGHCDAKAAQQEPYLLPTWIL